MKQEQQGFTLIELVVVIVILGILAATALPKFIDLRSDAEQAAINGVAGGLSSASATNFAGCAVTNNAVTAAPDNRCSKVAKCSDVGLLLQPTLTLAATASTTAYYLSSDAASTTNGTGVTCTINKATSLGPTVVGPTTTYIAIGAGN